MSIRQAGEDTFRKIWDDAVEKYKVESGNTIGDPINIPDDMEGLTRNVDERQKDFTAFRKKRKRIFDVLDPLVNLIKRFADTMGEGAALAPVSGYLPRISRIQTLTVRCLHSACISGETHLLCNQRTYCSTSLPSRFTFNHSRVTLVQRIVVYQAAKDVEKSYDSIIDLFESLSYMLQRYEIHLVHEPTPAIREIMVQALAHMLTILGLATKRIKNGRTREFILSSTLYQLV